MESYYSKKLNVGQSDTIYLIDYYNKHQLCPNDSCYLHANVVLGFDPNSGDHFNFVVTNSTPTEYKISGTIWAPSFSRR